MGQDGKSPQRTAFATFAGFVVAGWAPLFPYLLGLAPAFRFSIPLTGLAFFGVGASRRLVTDRRWLINGGEMFAATIAFVVGTLLKGLA